MKSLEQIRTLWEARRRDRGPVQSRMRAIAQHYNGDVVVPLPELDEDEAAAVANLFQQGLDQMGMRVSSTMPHVYFPPTRPGIKRSEGAAAAKRNTVYGWWQDNKAKLKMRRRSRWLIGYAEAPVMLRPDRRRRIPKWELCHPLTTFCAPCLDPDDINPPDAIREYTRSREWIQQSYPEAWPKLRSGEAAHFTLLEYVDADEHVLMVIGEPEPPVQQYETNLARAPGEELVLLVRSENRAGRCTVTAPHRITLDRPIGQYDGMVGLFQTQARLMALNVIAVERGILPEQWIVSPEGQTASVIVEADARNGVIGQISGGTLETVKVDPGFLTPSTIDRLEYAQRHTAGIPSEFGGSSSSNIRTGRRGDSVMSAVVDFHVQEAQEIFEHCLHDENEIAVDIAKGYFGNEAKSFYVGHKSVRSGVTYTPDDLFADSCEHTVTYSYAGADENALNIAGGQMVGMGAMSKRTFQEIHPMIRDVEVEHDQVMKEAVEAAGLASVQTMASNPEGPWQPIDFALFGKLIATDKMELWDAMEEVQRVAQERQAQQVPPGSPEAMPGLSPPGQGAEGTPIIGEPEPSMGNLREMLSNQRLVQMAGAAEQRGI